MENLDIRKWPGVSTKVNNHARTGEKGSRPIEAIPKASNIPLTLTGVLVVAVRFEKALWLTSESRLLLLC